MGGSSEQKSRRPQTYNLKESLCYTEGDYGWMKKDQLRAVLSTRGILLKGHLAVCADTCGYPNWAGRRSASVI